MASFLVPQHLTKAIPFLLGNLENNLLGKTSPFIIVTPLKSTQSAVPRAIATQDAVGRSDDDRDRSSGLRASEEGSYRHDDGPGPAGNFWRH